MSSTPRIIIGGTIAIDHVKTPAAEAQNLLGGSAAYAALAASFFSRPVDLIGIIGHDFPKDHLEMLEKHGVTLTGVERSENESFTWSGEYHANMNERTTHRVGLNVLENWSVKVPAASASAEIVVLANMSPDNQLEMLAQCQASPDQQSRFVIADTMDLWIEIAAPRLHEVLPQLDLFVLNEGEARALAGTTNLVQAGQLLLEKGPRHVIIKLGEFGAMLFSKQQEAGSTEPRIEEPSTSSSSPSTIHSPPSTSSSSSSPSAINHQPSTSQPSTSQPSTSQPSTFFRCSAYPLQTVADPTGAGDTFLGGMAGYLAAQGHPPYDAPTLRRAIVQGSILASFTCEDFSTRRMETLSTADLEARVQEFTALTAW